MAEELCPCGLHDAQLSTFNAGPIACCAMPADIADQIGGWATNGVGQGYGSVYPIEVLMDWVGKTVAATDVG